MKRIKLINLRILLTLIGSFMAPVVVLAVVQTLNSATGQDQTFVNDSNVKITTNLSNNTHTLGWNGHLPVNRGGTGTGSFTAGSVIFANGASISENNSNLFWDNANLRLGIATSSPEYTLDVKGDVRLNSFVFDSTGSIISRSSLTVWGGDGFDMRTLDDSGGSADIQLLAGGDTLGNGNGGSVVIRSGSATPGDNNGNIILQTITGGGTPGKVFISSNGSGNGFASFDTNGISGGTGSAKLFTFPNFSGTFSLLEINQTFTGLNKFEATASSSIYIGSSSKSGCISLYPISCKLCLQSNG